MEHQACHYKFTESRHRYKFNIRVKSTQQIKSILIGSGKSNDLLRSLMKFLGNKLQKFFQNANILKEPVEQFASYWVQLAPGDPATLVLIWCKLHSSDSSFFAPEHLQPWTGMKTVFTDIKILTIKKQTRMSEKDHPWIIQG